MKTGLNLNLSHSLTLTPQLQQAIRLLQLSTLELNQEILQLVETNPLLEIEAETTEENIDKEAANDQIEEADEEQTEMSVDVNWDDVYTQPLPPKSNSNEDENVNLENIIFSTQSLQEHLRWQSELTPFSDIDRLIAHVIIEAINEDGFLTQSVEDIHTAVLCQAPMNVFIELDEIEMVLHRIQRFDPAGVGARTLSECLMLQLQYLSSDTPFLNQTKSIVSQHLDYVAQHNYKSLLKLYKLKEDELHQILRMIKSLNPHPGQLIQPPKTDYVVPDVVVRKESGRYLVELNPDSLPRLRINNHYASLVQRADTSTDNLFIKNHLQEARWFLKSLQSRHETLLKVASFIVKHQQEFLEQGEEWMKPLVLHDVATALDLHESTISRVTTQKFMYTPRGVFELKYFFSSHVGTAAGGECSSIAIRAILKKLVANENPKKPLSDQKISEMMKKQGINVARRTIAKYREAMNIPPSHERKMLLLEPL